MIDYHGDCVALSTFIAELSAAVFADATTADARDRTLSAVGAEEGPGLLGAFVHHLLGHSATDGAEIALLQQAADLWARGANLCTELGTIRADLEGALENPGDPGSADRFNNAVVSSQNFANIVIGMNTEIDSLRTDVLKFAHLPSHPRQSDSMTDTWDWGNLTLGRRTDAFVRNLSRLATTRQMLAFATGAASSYGGNVAGSAYLGHVVGGPRRTQRYRDRIARNAVGSWLAIHHTLAMSLATMANKVTFGPPGSPTLPSELETLVHGALSETFDLGLTVPLPDLQLGYRRLITHLNLLDDFSRPAVPAPPAPVWMATLYGDLQNPPPSLRPQDVDVVGQDGGGVAVEYGPPSPGSSSPDSSDSSQTSKGCGIALLIIIVVDLIQAFVQCIGQWANHHTCTFWDNMLLKKLWEEDPPDPRDQQDPRNPNVTSAQLVAIAGSQQAVELVGILFDAHCQAWEAMDRAYVFLANSGLIYPGDLMTMPLYTQFTSIPLGRPWPNREEPDPPSTYHLYPSSPLENPTTTPSPFSTGARPDVYLKPNGELNATNITFQLWRQIAAEDQDSQNFDLDGDRGATHQCWAANGSVLNDPVDVRILTYDEQ